MNETTSDAEHIRKTLRLRAEALARPVAAPADETEFLEVLEFGLAEERYALETAHVHEVQPLRRLAPIPCTPPFLRGLVHLRGRLVAVIDLKKFFDLPEHGITDLHHVVVLQKSEMDIGLLADTVYGVRMLPRDAVQPPLPTLTGIRADYLKGITAERVVVLDAPRILADPRFIIDENVHS